MSFSGTSFPRLFWILRFLLVLVIIVCVLFVLFKLDILIRWEPKSLDLLFHLSSRPSTEKIVVVKADEKSERYLKKEWGAEWREYHPQLIRNIIKAKPKVIAFDLVFPHREKLEEYDKKFVETIIEANEVVKAVIIGSDERTPPSLDEVTKSGYLSGLVQDYDNKIRGLCLLKKVEEKREGLILERKYEPSFALQVVAGYEDLDLQKDLRIKDKTIKLGAYNIPVKEQNFILINFAGEEGAFESFSYSDVYKATNGSIKTNDRTYPIEFFTDKIVLIGATITRLIGGIKEKPDFRKTPFGGMYGVEFQANVINTILEKANIRQLDGFSTWTILLLFVLLIALSATRPGIKLSVYTLVILFAATWFLGIFAFFFTQLWFPIIFLCSAISIATVVTLLLRLRWRKLFQPVSRKSQVVPYKIFPSVISFTSGYMLAIISGWSPYISFITAAVVLVLTAIATYKFRK